MAGRGPLPDHPLDLPGISDLDRDELDAELCPGKDFGHLLAVQPHHIGNDPLAGDDELASGRLL